MPLLDHFHPPLSRTHPWRSFHSGWAAAMSRLLNAGVLPAGFYAVPNVDRPGPVEIDVATLRDAGSTPPGGETMPQPWSPPAGVAVAVDWAGIDSLEVQIFSDEGDPRLAAAVELLSPRNKDRPESRQAFAVKCVSYLQQGAGLVMIDSVTTRRADLHSAILDLLGVQAGTASNDLRAVSYQAVDAAQDEQGTLRYWPAVLALGEPLPTLPLWIAADFSVPLDLEASYQAACVDLRITTSMRQAGGM